MHMCCAAAVVTKCKIKNPCNVRGRRELAAAAGALRHEQPVPGDGGDRRARAGRQALKSQTLNTQKRPLQCARQA